MNENEIIRNRKKIFLLLLVAFPLLIIVIAVIITSLSDTNFGVITRNEDSLEAENEGIVLDAGDLKALKEQIRNISKVPDDEEIYVSFREGSYKEHHVNGTSESSTQIEVLIDIENTKTTYLASINHGTNNFYGISLSCTDAATAKWPETFCVGSNFHSSIDTNIADILPYRKMVDGVLKYTIKHADNQAKLEVSVNAVCSDKEAETEAVEAAKALLTKYGIDGDQIPVYVKETSCKAYEDSYINRYGP